jgi:hypothetical protein
MILVLYWTGSLSDSVEKGLTVRKGIVYRMIDRYNLEFPQVSILSLLSTHAGCFVPRSPFLWLTYSYLVLRRRLCPLFP